MNERYSRRDFLKLSALVLGSVGLSACVPEGPYAGETGVFPAQSEGEAAGQVEGGQVPSQVADEIVAEDNCQYLENTPDKAGEVVWRKDTYTIIPDDPVAAANGTIYCNFDTVPAQQ